MGIYFTIYTSTFTHTHVHYTYTWAIIPPSQIEIEFRRRLKKAIHSVAFCRLVWLERQMEFSSFGPKAGMPVMGLNIGMEQWRRWNETTFPTK